MDWISLECIALGWILLEWIAWFGHRFGAVGYVGCVFGWGISFGLDWIALGVGLDWIGLDWVRLDWLDFGWIRFHWSRLVSIAIDWFLDLDLDQGPEP